MAAADYYLCDVCDGKTFYDAHVQYENWETGKIENYKPNGKPIPIGVGDMIVLCPDCAKTHQIVIEPIKGE
jgi:hypothetical protein